MKILSIILLLLSGALVVIGLAILDYNLKGTTKHEENIYYYGFLVGFISMGSIFIAALI